MRPSRTLTYSARFDALARQLWNAGEPWPEGWPQEPCARWIAKARIERLMEKQGYSAGEIERVLTRGIDLFETYGYSVRWIPGAPWAWLYNEWIATGEKEAA